MRAASPISITIESVDLGSILRLDLSRWLSRCADALCNLLKGLLRRIPALELLLGGCVVWMKILRSKTIGVAVGSGRDRL